MGHFETLRDQEAHLDDIEFFPNLNLNDTQLRAIELTVQCYSDTQISTMLGINRRTLWRWKNFDDDFRRALENVRMQTHAAVIDRYSTLLARSTSVFAKMLSDPAEDKQFRAAQTLINMAGSFRPVAARLSPPKQNDDWPEPILEPKIG
jgi:hypothetical protein